MTVMRPPTRRREASALEHALARVGDRWTLLVVDALRLGPRRFNDLLEAIPGIASNVLSARLKHLEAHNVITSRPYQHRPPRLAYELTAAGKNLAGALLVLAQWGATQASPREGIRHEACGTPLEARWYCPTCARSVEESEGSEVRYL